VLADPVPHALDVVPRIDIVSESRKIQADRTKMFREPRRTAGTVKRLEVGDVAKRECVGGSVAGRDERRCSRRQLLDLHISVSSGALPLIASTTVSDLRKSSTRSRGTLTVRLSLPSGTERTPVHFRAGARDRIVSVSPGERQTIAFSFARRGPWRVVFRTPKNGVLSDGRAISVQADDPRLSRAL